MRVVAKALDDPLDVLVDDGVVGNVVLERVVLTLRGKLAVEKQVSDLEVVRLFGKLFDRIATVPQDSLLTVDVSDPALAGRGVLECRVVALEPVVVVVDADLAQIRRTDSAIFDGNFVGLARTIVGNVERIAAHKALPSCVERGRSRT